MAETIKPQGNLTEGQMAFVEALHRFTEAASDLMRAWEHEDVPDDIGAPHYPFQGDFTELAVALPEWRFAVDQQLGVGRYARIEVDHGD